MLLLLEEDMKKKLLIFTQLETSVVRELCLSGLDFMITGINSRLYTNASHKLNISEESIREAIETIMFIITQSCRLSLSEIDFKDSLMTFGLSDSLQKEMLEWYSSNRQTVREVLSKMDRESGSTLRYTNLEWRFQSEIASRSLRDELKPYIILRFELNDNSVKSECDNKKYVTLACDASNLFHMHDVIEEALSDSRSQHLLKIVRHVK